MLKKMLENKIQVIDSIENWEVAIRVASIPLLENRDINSEYVEAMIDNIRKLGPYVVLMPRVAMPHSRPEHGVNNSSISLLKVNDGVLFEGKDERVNLFFILAARDSSSHIDVITELTDLLGDDKRVDEMLNARDYESLYSVI